MPHKQKHKDRHYCDENNPQTCVVEKPCLRRRRPKTGGIFHNAPKKMSTHLLFKSALVIS